MLKVYNHFIHPRTHSWTFFLLCLYRCGRRATNFGPTIACKSGGLKSQIPCWIYSGWSWSQSCFVCNFLAIVWKRNRGKTAVQRIFFFRLFAIKKSHILKKKEKRFDRKNILLWGEIVVMHEVFTLRTRNRDLSSHLKHFFHPSVQGVKILAVAIFSSVAISCMEGKHTTKDNYFPQ